MKKTTHSTQVAVIGGGPGGYTAAFMAADLGLQVTLIDLEPNPGGVCLYRGCIPSKALLHVAKVLTESREATQWGIEFGEPKIDLNQMRSWKESVVGKMTQGLGELCKHRNVQFIQGRASFLDSTTLKIEQNDRAISVSYDHAVLATGSRPATIPNLSLDSPRVLDSTGALELREVPKNMLVIGGGYIGLELGTVYSALGCEVSVVEMTSGLLPGVDRDLVGILTRQLKTHFHAIMLNTKVVQLREEANGIQVRLEGENLQDSEHVFEQVLIAVGRKANTNGVGLENTKVQINQSGFVHVDAQRRTTDSRIYAIGDVAGQPMLAHKAAYEARIAAEAIAGHKVAFEPRAIPAVVFTDPEIAWCGLTETQAKAENRSVEVCRFPWGASGRAMTLSRVDGVTKLIIDPETEQVLGVGIVGSGAGELIAEGVLAIEMAAVASDLQWSIHPHPTLSETVMEAAEVFFGQSVHIYRPKKA
ncbi:dihydrolipoyl dehydrogenase [Candidatus Poribacteria bacterium]|nr:dihydrolipoyl dehydrogenase [Candidatus Poribacteria bacterium]